MRIIFMGTPEFAVPSLNRLVSNDRKPVTVVTGPDRPRGRGQKVSPTPVKKSAQKHNIPVLQPDSVRAPSFAETIRNLQPDLIVVVAFKILPPDVFVPARLGAFNLHASLLPAYRGPAPINWAIINGESKTGVTTFFLEEQVDTGPIILQKETAIDPMETAGDLHDRLMEMGADAVLETVNRIQNGNVSTRPQDDDRASGAPKISTDDCKVPWTRSAEEVHNFIRGLAPYPGAWTRHGDTRLKIYLSKPVEDAGPPGQVLASDDRLVVACGINAVEILKIQQSGRKTLPADDFLNGYELSAGETFE